MVEELEDGLMVDEAQLMQIPQDDGDEADEEATIMQLLEYLKDASTADEQLDEELKSARSYAGALRRLAEAVGEKPKELLVALAVVLSHAQPAEFPALAAILRRVAPKSVGEKAEQLASKMEQEASQPGYPGYQQSQPEYPEPKKRQEQIEQLAEPAQPSIADLQARLDELGQQLGGLMEHVKTLQEDLRQQGEAVTKQYRLLLAGAGDASVTPKAREVVSPPAALLAALGVPKE